MTDLIGKSKLQFRFSVWDLILLTSFVAILCASPAAILVPLVALSMLVAILLGYFFFETMFFGTKKHWQTGVMQRMRKVVIRGFLYAVFVLAVSALVLLARGEF